MGGAHRHGRLPRLAGWPPQPPDRWFGSSIARVCDPSLQGVLEAGGDQRSYNHLVLWDLRPHGLTGSKVEKVCEVCSISLNRNAVHGDASALSPGGVRIGSPAMTTRGCNPDQFKQIALFLDRVCQISLKVQQEKGK